MEKPHYKCIILVLASDNQPLYRYFKKVYLSYMDRHPEVKILFTYGDGVKFEPQPWDLVFKDVKETYTTPHMAMKTVKAFEYIDQNFTYDYVVRTNLSVFWILDKLVEKLDELPTTKCLAGRLGILKPDFITGTGMFISGDMIPLIVRDRDIAVYKYHKYIPEDRMISEYFTKYCEATIKELTALYFIEHKSSVGILDEEIKKGMKSDCTAFRLKNLANRELIDTTAMRKLCYNFYEVDIGDYDGNVQ